MARRKVIRSILPHCARGRRPAVAVIRYATSCANCAPTDARMNCYFCSLPSHSHPTLPLSILRSLFHGDTHTIKFITTPMAAQNVCYLVIHPCGHPPYTHTHAHAQQCTGVYHYNSYSCPLATGPEVECKLYLREQCTKQCKHETVAIDTSSVQPCTCVYTIYVATHLPQD